MEALIKVQKMFLVAFPLHSIDWNDVLKELNSQDNQIRLLNLTLGHKDVKKYPVKPAYQRSFLKHVILKLEADGLEVAEELYHAHCDLLSAESCDNDVHFRHYILPSQTGDISSIIIQESTKFLSSGTTGLSSWQAGVTLAEWCLSNASELSGRCVLELGSGCGLAGLVAATACQADQVLLSDGHEGVVEQLSRNVELNLGQSERQLSSRQRARTKCGQTDVQVLYLPWEDAPDCPDVNSPDVILAADVVFDPSLFVALKDALKYFLSQKESSKAVLACTVRNENTLYNFLQLLESSNLNVKNGIVPQQVFSFERPFPVKMFIITDQL